nr:hypothetical protein [Tanacetum cinerariifolium]
MDTTIDQHVAMDEALVPHAKRLRIGRSNFLLLADIKSKESTLQLVYDVLRLTLFFKAFLVIADVPKIYMQEFWATATVHHYAIRFKMNNKKHIVYLESFRDMLHICPMVPGQYFVEPPFEEEILAFIRFLRHRVTVAVGCGVGNDDGDGVRWRWQRGGDVDVGSVVMVWMVVVAVGCGGAVNRRRRQLGWGVGGGGGA